MNFNSYMQYNYYFATNFKLYINFFKKMKLAIFLFLRCLDIPVVAEIVEPGNPQSGQPPTFLLVIHLFIKCILFLSQAVFYVLEMKG